MSENPNYRSYPQYRPAPDDGELDDAALDQVVGGLVSPSQAQEVQASFNSQYFAVQNQMQSENRSYTAVSNIMKTKHDTVKNSISNIR